MKHLNNSELIQEATLLLSATPGAILTHVSYPPNFPHVPYLMRDETRGGRSNHGVAAGLQFVGP